ncbi:hypothetical protein TNCV_1978621 [Trichonephila clavipes]|nr:hypothetical protein TNCV_1978621 [Trichonephila clavipes]
MLAPPAKSGFVPQTGAYKRYIFGVSQTLGPPKVLDPLPSPQCGGCRGVRYATVGSSGQGMVLTSVKLPLEAGVEICCVLR